LQMENDILRVAMLRLRRKLEADPSNPLLLRTHVGMGYSLGL
jgi:DNA-binding response OmpR family regulator